MGLPWYRVHTVVLNDPGRLIAVQLYKAQRQQFSDYPDAIANVIYSGKQHRQYLRSSISSLI